VVREDALLGLALLAAAAPVLAVSDAEVRRRVEERLVRAGFDKRADIHVEVNTGVVRLTGNHRALPRPPRSRPARPQGGEERREPPPRRPRDAAVGPGDPRGRQTAVLRWARYGPFDAVGIEVKDGVVKLGGWVEDPFKRNEVEELLARVDAVRDVLNNLRVQGSPRATCASGRRSTRRSTATRSSSAGGTIPTRRCVST